MLDSKSSGGDTVPVRPRSPAPDKALVLCRIKALFFYYITVEPSVHPLRFANGGAKRTYNCCLRQQAKRGCRPRSPAPDKALVLCRIKALFFYYITVEPSVHPLRFANGGAKRTYNCCLRQQAKRGCRPRSPAPRKTEKFLLPGLLIFFYLPNK